MKGQYTTIADDPEIQRHQRNTTNASLVQHLGALDGAYACFTKC